MKNFLFISLFALLVLNSCISENHPKGTTQEADSSSFTFAFLTDIHLQPERNATAGFEQAIDTVNHLQPDFVITGGDLIMDALGQTESRSDSLYQLYMKSQEKFQMPVYNTLGNHEVFGLYEKSGIRPEHELFGKKMYNKYLGDRYSSFSHKGWHFMLLDAIGYTPERRYIGHIDSLQMLWIKDELSKVDKETPICVSTHIPFLSIFTQMESGPFEANHPGLVVENFHEVLELFKNHNLKLVLQGHLHYLEDIEVQGIHFITGGAVSGKWWTGANRGIEEGFLLLHVDGDNFSWEYVDYGWEVKEGE